jgi:hypothetical protein
MTVTINTTCNIDYAKILYSQTSTTPGVTDAAWENCASTKSYSVTSGDGVKNIYAFTKDSAGNISSSSNVTMTLDTTPPGAPAANLASGAITSSTTVSFTITDCLDRPQVLVSESVIAPLVSDSGWQTCSTTSAAINYTLIGPVLQGQRLLYVYAKDAVGNISSSTTAAITYDSINPTLSLSASLDLLYKGGNTIPLSFGASDLNGLSSFRLEYTTDGTNYSLSHTFAPTDSAYTWTVPASNTTTARIRLVAEDNATPANTSIAYSDVFAVDSTPPSAPTLARTSNAFSTSTAVTMTVGSCTDSYSILITETNTQPSASASGWQLCSTTTSAITATVSGEGPHTLYAWAKDLAQNVAVSANSISMTLDTIAPVLAVTTPGPMIGNVNTGSVSWTLTEKNVAGGTNFTVEIYDGSGWSSVGTKAAITGINTNQAYTLSNFTVPYVDVATAKIRVTIADAAESSTSTETNAFAIASTPPSIGTIQINNGALVTTSTYVSVALAATSPVVNVSQFCLKTTSATPTLGNACWVPLDSPQPNITPGLNISFSNYHYLLSFTPGPYTIYGWVRDTAGNISNYASSTITVETPTPPTVSHILVANISNTSDPVAVTEKTFNGVQAAYIKWNVTSTAATTISLSYQTNSGSTAIISGLTNGPNAGCTVNDTTTADDQATGCFIWNSPPTQYFSVTVKAIDENGVSSESSSYPLNASVINYLAGKVDLGLGTSALSSILKISSSWTDVGSLVVTTDGRIFLRDRTLGLVMVDPKDGVLQRVMRITGTASGDGGPVTNATLCAAQKIALDFQDRILIFDCTKIRRINTAVTPMTIETIVGGGASQANATAALSFQITHPGLTDGAGAIKSMPFFALPNGDIYFTSGFNASSTNDGFRIRKYQASDTKVYAIAPSGIGHAEDAAVDIATRPVGNGSAFGFVYNTINSQISKVILEVSRSYTGDSGGVYTNLDPVSFVSTAPHPAKSGLSDFFIQGMDGKLYVHDARVGTFRRFNESTHTFTTLVGGGTNTNCPDGTLATACKVNDGFTGFDAFVAANGQIYFIDFVGIVRTVLADGTVRRIMGQSKGAGDGNLASEARANSVSWVDQATDGTIFFSDDAENRIRKFTINGNISAHAGNASSSAAFLLNSTTKEIYSRIGSSAYKLPFATPTWTSIGTISKTVNSELNSPSEMLGYDGSSSLLYNILPAWNSTQGYRDYKLASFNWATPAVSVLTNFSGSTGTFCAHGTLASACSVFLNTGARAQYDSLPVTPRWIMLKSGTNRVVALNKDGMNNNEVLLTVATLPKNANSFFYRNIAGTEVIYYCATDGSLNSYNISTSTNTAFSWPITSLTCSGLTMNYNSSRDSLIFPARQNGLSTIIEYKFNP